MMAAVRIDDVDLKILRLLRHDSRKSYREISDEVGVSAGTARNRIRHMRSSGLVSFNIQLDHSLLGFGVHATLMLTIRPGRIRDVARALVDLPETEYVATLAGTYDIIVDVYCRDVSHLMDFLSAKIHSIDDAVSVSMHLVTDINYKTSSILLDTTTDLD